MDNNAKPKSAKPAKSRILSAPKKAFHALFFVLLFALTAGGVFLVLFDLNFSGKIYPRVSVAGENFGDISPKAAQRFMENKIDLWRNQKIQIDYGELNNSFAPKKWQLEAEKMGFLPSAFKTTLAAYNFGRAGNPLKATLNKIKIITKGENFPVYYDFTENKFSDYFESNFSFLEKPGKDAALAISGGKILEMPAQNGYKINRLKFKEEVSLDIKNLETKPISLEIKPYGPEITDDKIKDASLQARNLLSDKISLQFEDKSWTLDQELMKSFIKFEPAEDGEGKTVLGMKIDASPIIDYLEKIQLEVNREPSNAVFGEKDGSIIIESGGETGAVLGIEKSAEKISGEMLKAAKENITGDVGIKLVIEEKYPAIGKKTLDSLEINALIGQGKSNFAGSPKNRRYNIGVGAAKFNNIVIAPDEEFSFVKTLGEVTEKAGYLPELVIKGDKTIPELGGGLCQVSTTAFRAAIYSGLPILERKPHAYPVIYYNPQGMDATIYPPHPDLRFKNDTAGNILIQTQIIKNELIFNFFGVKQKRTVKVIGPDVYDKQPDGSMKAIFWREIYGENGDLLKKDSFFSAYSSPSKFPHKNPLE